MKYLSFLLLLVSLPIFSQNLLSPVWKFQTGDDMIYANPDYNDEDWKIIVAGKYWENQGYEGYDGFAWYRKAVLVPSELKNAAKKNGGFILELGRIDDADEIFWNGTKILSSGTMPPDYSTAYDKNRKIIIPVKDIIWDSNNLIAIRVYDGSGNGGMEGPNTNFSVIGMDELLKIEGVFSTDDHIFINSHKVRIPITIKNAFPNNISGKLEYTIHNDFGTKIYSNSTDIKVKKNSTFQEVIEIDTPDPGFYEVNIQFNSTLENKKHVFRFGVDPEKIVSPTDRPSDFDNFWDRARKELAAVDPQFKMIYMEDQSSADREVYLIEMRSLGNVLIRGWYGKPRKEGNYPAILHVQGYSTNQLMGWGYPQNDMAVLVLNVRGHGNSQDHVNPGFPGYLQYFINDPEMYIYRGAYMDCLRAVDFLFSRPEVDKSRIVVEGGSQGGALSFATAALDNKRITLCVPHVPFLSDFRDYFAIAQWPAAEFLNYADSHPETDHEMIYNTLSYFDIKNLAPWIKAPVLMGVGLMDETCPPHINFAAYNNLNVEREYLIYPWSGHGIDKDYHRMKYDWIKKKFGI